MTGPDCDVLIVGAGPTGLTLAAQLLTQGVSTRIIDEHDGTPRLSRAVGTQPRTLEMLDTMGIVDRFLDVGHVVRRVNLYSGDKRLIRIDHVHNASRYDFELHVPQQQTEDLLLGRVRELGGRVESGSTLLDFVDDGTSVTASVRDATGGTRVVSAGYLVGCDGAHSRVRKLLDLPFEGQPLPWDFLLADAQIDWRAEPDEVHVFSGAVGLPLACIPISKRLWRLSLPMPEGWRCAAPTLDELQRVVDERSPWPIGVSDPETLTTFRCQVRSTSTYRRGRVFIAGDAAHIQSPAGAQGMNSGMLDAANLAWKLALVVRGRARDALLDTYGEERRPAAAEVIAFSERMVRIATMRSVKRTVQRMTLPAYRLPSVQRRMAERLSQTAIDYRAGGLVEFGRSTGGPRPGARCRDVALAVGDGAGTLYEALRGGRHVLVTRVGSEDAAGRALLDTDYRDLVDVVSADVCGWDGSVLVRPDGHVAVSAARNDFATVLAYLAGYAAERTQGAVS